MPRLNIHELLYPLSSYIFIAWYPPTTVFRYAAATKRSPRERVKDGFQIFSFPLCIPLQLTPPYDAETKALVGNGCYHMVIITNIRTEWQGDWSGMLGSAPEAWRLTTRRRCEGNRSMVLLSMVAIWRATLFWPTASPRPPKRCGSPLRMLGAIPAVEKATLEVDAWPDYTVTTERPPPHHPHLAPFVTHPSTSHFRIFPAICLVIPFNEILALISVAS